MTNADTELITLLPFARINCTSLPRNLPTSRMFFRRVVVDGGQIDRDVLHTSCFADTGPPLTVRITGLNR